MGEGDVTRWQYLVVSPNEVPPSRYEILVGRESRDALIQHLTAEVPECKAHINKNRVIEIDAIYAPQVLWDILGEQGWELLEGGGVGWVFKRPYA